MLKVIHMSISNLFWALNKMLIVTVSIYEAEQKCHGYEAKAYCSIHYEIHPNNNHPPRCIDFSNESLNSRMSTNV